MSLLGRVASATGIVERLRGAWKRDVHRAVEPLRADVARLARELESLRSAIDAIEASRAAAVQRADHAEKVSKRLRQMAKIDERQRERLAQCSTILDERAVGAHVRRTILGTPLALEPFPHAIVSNVLPDEVYRLVRESIPPAAFFGDRDPIKQNMRFPVETVPALTSRVWNFVDDFVARSAIRPAVIELFHEHLQAHYDTLFGAAFRDRAAALPQAASGGRLMLRRPGYHLAPHRDPKRTMLTCLFYLAGEGDNVDWGTEIYRVLDDGESSYSQTYYPEQDGRRCELVGKVPYRPNTMLVFLNSRGAHGARIPGDAPAKTERFSYQFYVGPEAEALDALIEDLPPERQQMWKDKRASAAQM